MNINTRRHKRSVFKKMTVELGLLETDTFESDDLISVLSDITFELINISLTVKKSEVGLTGPGFTPIGFVNKFYMDEEGHYKFDVAIFEKYSKIVERMETTDDEALIISARAFTNRDGKITKIIGLDLTPIAE